ncbi:hypothetical protein MRX96_058156 [Rhipicephalus microplus]
MKLAGQTWHPDGSLIGRRPARTVAIGLDGVVGRLSPPAGWGSAVLLRGTLVDPTSSTELVAIAGGVCLCRRRVNGRSLPFSN